jgi:hypothetical protein
MIWIFFLKKQRAAKINYTSSNSNANWSDLALWEVLQVIRQFSLAVFVLLPFSFPKSSSWLQCCACGMENTSGFRRLWWEGYS